MSLGIEKRGTSWFGRIIGAARLDRHFYHEISAGESALWQSFAVVALSSAAAGAGPFLRAGPVGFVAAFFSAVLSWLIWSYLAYFIGLKLLPESQTGPNFRGFMSAAGFSNAPGIIRVLAIIPGLAGFSFLAATFWTIAAMALAAGMALHYKSLLRGAAVSILGWIGQALILGALVYLASKGGM